MRASDSTRRTALALVVLVLWPGLAQAAASGEPPAGQALFDQAAAKIATREFDAALKLMRQAAEAGHVAAIGEIGSFYLHGLGVAKDPKEAVAWYRRAADLGGLEAMHNLGFLYLSGQGVALDVDQGLGWLRRAAGGGLVQSQLTLGNLYFEGQQVARDYPEARRWIELAAGTGNATAQASMGTLYLRGYGVEKDESEAVAWFTRAAEQGLALAQYNLGQFYLGRLDVAASNAGLGIQWLSRAAEQGHAQAAHELAGFYQKGEKGVAIDAEKALTWLTVAANNGHAEAQYELGRRYQEADGVKVDLATARRFYGLAAQQGHSGAQIALLGLNIEVHGLQSVPAGTIDAQRQRAERGEAKAQYELGDAYRYGHGVRRDLAESERWLRRAAEQGLSAAQADLGEMLSDDEDPGDDLVQAADWFRRAAEQDHARAAYRLGLAFARGDGVHHDEGEALRWFRRVLESEVDDAAASDAAYMIGYHHFHGLGVPRNWREASRWFRRAAGSEPGHSFGHWAYEHRYGEELFLDPTLAYVWFTLAVEGGESDEASGLKDVSRGLAPNQREPGDGFLALWRKENESLAAQRGSHGQEPAERSLEEWVTVLGTSPVSSADVSLAHQAERHVKVAGERAVPALVEALARADNTRAVRELSRPLAQLGKAAAAAIPVLERLLVDGPKRSRFSVASALARIDPRPDTPTLPLLEGCLADRSQDVSVRLGCIFALDEVGGGAGAVVLIATLEDEDAQLRRWAIEALKSAPIEVVRAPLAARLVDNDLDVRYAAALRLVAAAPPVPPAAVETLARDLCAADDSNLLAVDALTEPRELSGPAVEALAAGLRSGDASCRHWTAVLLGRLDPERATRALPALREAILSEVPLRRRAAAWTLANMGCAAHGELEALRSAAAADASLEPAAQSADRRSIGTYTPEHCKLDAFSLVVTLDEAGAMVAFVESPRHRHEKIAVGTRFLDGEVEAIEPGAIVVRVRRVADDLTLVAETRRVELFGRRPPEPLPAAAASAEALIDVDFEGDVATYLSFLASFGYNAILEPETSGSVHLVARRAPLSAALEHGLKASGFSSRSLGSFVVIGRGEERTLQRQALAIESEDPLSVFLVDAKVADLVAVIGRMLGVEIELPPGPHAPVTVFADQVPVPNLLEALLSSRGWAHRIEGSRIVVTAPPG